MRKHAISSLAVLVASILAAGAAVDQLFMADAPEPTAGDIISKEKKGSINRVFPGEMRGKTRSEIDELAKEGNRAARTARKLLTDKRFDKE